MIIGIKQAIAMQTQGNAKIEWEWGYLVDHKGKTFKVYPVVRYDKSKNIPGNFRDEVWLEFKGGQK